ncbi:uncharacterized protein LOC127858119 [Dreissena polymorpha]|uniref:uncharacterized protein LOC127858119 n=1 Tax=Dreissena polymorpha TaxID=45954 RepID=UPI0022647944|nr:uncharacterized protein LOC127858119 [Dreissena polymorpha]
MADFDTSSIIRADVLNIQHQSIQEEMENVARDRGGSDNHGHRGNQPRPRVPTDLRASHNASVRPTVRNLQMMNTPHFYDSIETDADSIKISQKKISKQKIKQSKRLPHWLWVIIVHILGINLPNPYLSRAVFGITVLSAACYTFLGVLYTAYDISSKNSKTTGSIGFISLLIGFSWLCLGIYSFRLAGRLFSDEDFAASVRTHSRTLLRISTVLLLNILGLGFTGLNLYCSYELYTQDYCETISLHSIVCTTTYVSRVVFSVLAMAWNMLVGCVLLSVCRTHTIGIRRFMRDLEEDGRQYEKYWKQKLLKAKVGQYHRDTSTILNNHEWFLMEEQDNILNEIMRGSGSRSEQPVAPSNIQEQTGGNSEQPDEPVSFGPEGNSLLPAPRNNAPAESIESSMESQTSRDDDGPLIMTDDELLLCYWKISSRMRYVSQSLQRWLASWMAFVLIWAADYVIYWLSHSPSILEIIEFLAPMLLLLVLGSAYAEANGEGQSMISCICPTKDRYNLMGFLHTQPLQMQVFNMSISYRAILTVLLAFAVAFASRLILDEISKT